jgi:hypothetical protein
MEAVIKNYITAFCLAVLCACGDSNKADFDGRFYVTMGPNPRGIMDIIQSENSITFTLEGAGFHVEGTGTVTENTLTLSALIEQLGLFESTVTSSDGARSFIGLWTITGETFMEGTLAGDRTPWATYDVESSGIPLIVNSDCIELTKMERVSKFRSGHGFDYSDDFESCRSMKHSYALKPGENPDACSIFAPFSGTVIGYLEDREGTTLWKGTTIGIQPDSHEAFWVLLFHVNLDSPLEVGDHVEAGQFLGKPKKEDGGTTVAVWVHTPDGDKLLSYFHVISDSLLARYQLRGVDSREAAIISKAERDADPLTCQGEEIVDTGNLGHWFILN